MASLSCLSIIVNSPLQQLQSYLSDEVKIWYTGIDLENEHMRQRKLFTAFWFVYLVSKKINWGCYFFSTCSAANNASNSSLHSGHISRWRCTSGNRCAGFSPRNCISANWSIRSWTSSQESSCSCVMDIMASATCASVGGDALRNRPCNQLKKFLIFGLTFNSGD